MKLPPGHVPGVGVVAATARGGLGERLLRKFGWTDGDGLGVGRSGRAVPIETVQKSDNAGVGARAPSFDWGDAWWERAFDGAAKSLASGAPASSSSSSSLSSSSSSSSSDCGLTTHRDGMATTATPAEMKLAARLARDKWGRFGGRDGKMARIAAMEAATADAARRKLDGAPPEPSTPNAAADDKKLKAGVDARPTKKVKKDKAASNRSKQAAAAASRPPPTADAPPPYTPPQGWWGAATFVHAGRLEGLDDPRPRAKKGGFTEEDQLAAATGGVARGDKRGLGAAAAKQLGRDWKGKKTRFGGG